MAIPAERPSVPALEVDVEKKGERWVGHHRRTGETYEADTAEDVIRHLCRKRQ